MAQADLMATLVAEKELDEELRSRAPRMVTPRIIEVAELGEAGSRLFPEGTIVSFAAEEGEELLDRVLEAVRKPNRKELDELGQELQRHEDDRLDRLSRPALYQSDHLVDVRYGGKQLARGLAPALVPVAVSRAIWTGGELDQDRFSAVDYVREGEERAVQVAIVMVRPRLSELEEGVLRAVPADVSEVHVKEPSLSWTPAARAGLHARFAGEGGSPLFQVIHDKTGQKQVQQQQNDKQIQQQQQQQQQDNKQQQQQQQQQDKNQTVQQEQQQQQDAGHNQQQQQQQQNAQTHQQQDQNQQDAQTNQQHQHQEGERMSWFEEGDDRQGVMLGGFERDEYYDRLKEANFEGLDATQSARALLNLRERFLQSGMP